MSSASKKSPRSRGWCFTINNPSEDDNPKSTTGWTYIVYQLESGDNGTPHYQGYVYFRNARALSSLKKLFPRAHLEPAGGTPQQNKAYCTKEEGRLGGPWELGQCPSPGARTDLKQLQADIDAGMRLDTIAVKHFSNWLRYARGIRSYRQLRMPRRAWKTEVCFIFGPRNTGKTRIVHDCSPGLYRKAHGSWWTGYDGQSDVLFDEFTSTKYGKITELNEWFDRYPMTVPIHHGVTQLCARRIWITSNMRPEELFPKIWEHNMAMVLAFWNRIEYIVEFKENGQFEFWREAQGLDWTEGFKRGH